MAAESVSFARPGGGTLAGTLHLPAQDPPLGYAIIADRLATDTLATLLALAGVAAVRIDFAELEDTVPAAVEAVLACARFLAATRAPAELLIGHATGASAVALALPSLPEVLGVATVDAAADGDGSPFRGADAPGDVSFLSLRNVSNSDVSQATVVAWAAALLAQPVAAVAEDVKPGGAVVAYTGPTYRTVIAAGRHSFVVDEPAALGGTDTGPTPYDLVGGALGSCTAITLRMYADRKQWPLEGVTVAVTHSRTHAVDDARCDSDDSARLDVLHRSIELHGDLDDEQRAKLLEIADKCPVHRTLDQGVRIDTVLTRS